jgi:phage baseplate assembly protein W
VAAAFAHLFPAQSESQGGLTMNAAKLFGRGIAFPPRVINGQLAWSEGETNVRESIRIILMTELEERIFLPDFGGSLQQFLFEPNTVSTRQLIADRIQNAVTLWEPRVVVESVIVEEDKNDPRSAIATLTYKLVATQTLERVSLNVALGN